MPSRIIYYGMMSLDGKDLLELPKLLSRMHIHRLQELRNNVDAIITDIDYIKQRNPDFSYVDDSIMKVIIDDKADISLDAKILSQKNVVLAVSKSAPHQKKETLSKIPDLKFFVSGEYIVNVSELLSKLSEHKVESVLIEGSKSLARRMLERGLINEIYIAILPVIVGEGETLLDKKLERDMKLSLEGITQYGDEVVLHYMIKY